SGIQKGPSVLPTAPLRMNRYFFGVGAGVGDELAPPGVLFGAAAGGGTLSGSGFFSLIESNSTSKIRVALGPIGPPGVPRGPYARSGGIKSCHLDPTGISCSASVQPLITPVTGNVAGSPRLYELSNSVPLIRVPL